jgi:uncharacterized protein DUF3754
MNTVENNQTNLQPLRILPIAFDDLLNITSKHLAKCLSSSDDDLPEQSQQQLEDFLFNLESMVFLDGEHRADSIMTRFLRWSGPGFTKRFFKKTIDLTESSFHDDLNFVTNQVETLLNLSHYKKLATEIVEKSLHHISYEKIFVRLQNIDFLNFYVRGSYMAEQSETMTRPMAKKMHAKEKWVSSILSPESVEVFEELTVIIGENIKQDEEDDIEVNDKDVVSPTQLNTQQMHRELHPYLQEESKKTVRPVVKRKRAIQRMVQEKMRQLQDKSLDQFMKERLVESKQLKRLHLLVYHHIPSTDLELLIPNAEISLGVKEYIQLCFAGTATIPALGKAIFTKSFRRMLMVFNPIFFGVYRIFYKMNIVKTEQKYSHARYMLKRLLARNAKAISHLVDDYENVLKREALLIITVLACQAKDPEGLTQTDLEKHCQEFIHENLQTDFEPDFSFSLKVLQHWGIVTCNANHNPPHFSLPALDELVSITSISRKNLKDKIWIET